MKYRVPVSIRRLLNGRGWGTRSLLSRAQASLARSHIVAPDAIFLTVCASSCDTLARSESFSQANGREHFDVDVGPLETDSLFMGTNCGLHMKLMGGVGA